MGHWRYLAIATNYCVLLVGALVARGASQVQGLWLLGLLVGHGLVHNYLTRVLCLVDVARGEVQVHLGVSDLRTVVCLGRWGRCLDF